LRRPGRYGEIGFAQERAGIARTLKSRYAGYQVGVFEAMVDLMGGLELFEGPVKRDADLERVVATGVPAEVVRHLAESTGMSLGELQEIALIEKSTLNRRIRQQALLKVYESDRIARVARVAALAMEA
jgi:uncharacterized protein (DUF2384 family)